MDALHGILTHFPLDIAQTIHMDQAKKLLRTLTLEKVQNILSEKELKVLLEMTKQGEFSGVDLSKHLGIQKQNMSKYMKKLLHTGYIHFVRQEGRKTIYTLSPEILYLQNILENKAQNSHSHNPSHTPLWNKRQQNFVKRARPGSHTSTAEYAQKFQISRPTAFRDIQVLEAKGVLRKLGIGRNTYFEVIKS
jgi:Fic family protein